MSKDDKSVIESIIMEDEDDNENTKPEVNSLQDTIKEIGHQLNKEQPKRKSNLTHTNISGLIQAECLNEYMDRNFGYRFGVLDELIVNTREYTISHKGFGIQMIIEGIKSIQASFEQTQIPDNMKGVIRR